MVLIDSGRKYVCHVVIGKARQLESIQTAPEDDSGFNECDISSSHSKNPHEWYEKL